MLTRRRLQTRVCPMADSLTVIREVGMAQKVTVELEDDLDGGPADETVRFGFDGSDYEIDLSKTNAARFRSQLEPYLAHARKAGRGQRRRSARTPSSRQHSGAVRAWAREQGPRIRLA